MAFFMPLEKKNQEQSIKQVIILTVLPQGAGKSSIGEIMEGVKYIDQDKYKGSKSETVRKFIESIDTDTHVFVGRNNQNPKTIDGFILPNPNLYYQLVGDGLPTAVHFLISLCGVIDRTPDKLLHEGYILIGGNKMLWDTCFEIIQKTQSEIKKTYYGPKPYGYVVNMERFNPKNPRLLELSEMFSKYQTTQEQIEFLCKNKDEVFSHVKPAKQVAAELVKMIETLKGPPTPERDKLMKYQFLPTIQKLSLSEHVKYVCGKVPKENWKGLTQLGFKTFSPVNGKLAEGHVTFWHFMNGESLPKGIPENVMCNVSHIVKDIKTGCIGFRVRLSIKIQNEYPHITFYSTKKDGKLIPPVYTSEFVGSDDPSKVEVIPLDDKVFSPFELITEYK